MRVTNHAQKGSRRISVGKHDVGDVAPAIHRADPGGHSVLNLDLADLALGGNLYAVLVPECRQRLGNAAHAAGDKTPGALMASTLPMRW